MRIQCPGATHVGPLTCTAVQILNYQTYMRNLLAFESAQRPAAPEISNNVSATSFEEHTQHATRHLYSVAEARVGDDVPPVEINHVIFVSRRCFIANRCDEVWCDYLLFVLERRVANRRKGMMMLHAVSVGNRGELLVCGACCVFETNGFVLMKMICG